MITFMMSIPEDIKEALKTAADKEGVSQSLLCQQAILLLLNQKGHWPRSAKE